jgi:hypothetical protein
VFGKRKRGGGGGGGGAPAGGGGGGGGGLLPWGQTDRGVQLTTHLPLVRRVRICGAITPLFHTTWWCAQQQIYLYPSVRDLLDLKL